MIKFYKRLFIDYGTRNGTALQFWPVWNTSHNQQRSILFEFGQIESVYKDADMLERLAEKIKDQ